MDLKPNQWIYMTINWLNTYENKTYIYMYDPNTFLEITLSVYVNLTSGLEIIVFIFYTELRTSPASESVPGVGSF